MRVDAYDTNGLTPYGPAFYSDAYPAFDVSALPPDAFTPAAAPLAAAAMAMRSASSDSASGPGGGLQRVTDPQRFSRFVSLQDSVDAIESVLVLPAPTTERTFLYIQNRHATQSLYMDYDKGATTGSTEIPPGQDRPFSQVVPQNDIWLIGSGAGTNYVIEYANKKAE